MLFGYFQSRRLKRDVHEHFNYFQKFNAFSFSGLFEWFGPGPALKQGKLQQKTPETQRPRCLSGVQSVLRRERR